MLKNKKIILVAVAGILVILVAVATAIIVKNKLFKKPSEETRKAEPIAPKGAVKPVIPPKPADIVPPPTDIKKLLPPKKLEIPAPPPKLPELPPNVPTHIDIESLRAPSTTAPVANQ